MWTSLVELVQATIFTASHLLGGSLGAAIVVITALVRLALLPLVLRGARVARATQAKLQELRPQIERIKRRHANDPRRMLEETQALYRKHDVRLVTPGALASMAVQLPLLGALFSAVQNGLGARVRFLWIADLGRVDALLLLLVTSLTGVAAAVTPVTPGSPVTPKLLAGIVVASTVIFLWSASSAVALSVGAGSGVSLLQNWLLRRDALRAAR